MAARGFGKNSENGHTVISESLSKPRAATEGRPLQSDSAQGINFFSSDEVKVFTYEHEAHYSDALTITRIYLTRSE